MTRVLKTVAKPEPYHYKCRCGALLEVERADCAVVFDQRDGDYYSFRCPACKRIDALDAKLPKGWK